MKLPTLYSLTSKGQVQTWFIEFDQNRFRTTEGIKGGAMTESAWTVCNGKNLGKANETSPEDQAEKEARAKHKKKLESGYWENEADIHKSKFFEPMLAHKWTDYQGTEFPLYCSRKLDGCLDGSSLVKTKEFGYKPISHIVDNKLECKVLCRNVLKNKDEYKSVKSWFSNRRLDEAVVWYEITLSSGEKLTLTGNHKVYLPDLECWRRVDELSGEENLMVM